MNQQSSIVEYMNREAVKENIQKTIGKKTPQYIASVVSLVNQNERLAQCDQKSVLSACLIAASLDLPINPNLGFAYIIPYGDRAQFQMGYKGFIQLAQRSGQFYTINATDVREGEKKTYNRLTGEIEFSWIEENRNDAPIIGYVAYMRLINGFSKQLYMSVEECSKHGMRYSQMMKRKSGLWIDDFDAMAKKTVIKLLLSRYAPMTIEMQQATLADQAIINDDQYEYVDNEPINPNDLAKEKEIERLKKHIEQSKTIEELELCKKQAHEYDDDIIELYTKKESALMQEVSHV